MIQHMVTEAGLWHIVRGTVIDVVGASTCLPVRQLFTVNLLIPNGTGPNLACVSAQPLKTGTTNWWPITVFNDCFYKQIASRGFSTARSFPCSLPTRRYLFKSSSASNSRVSLSLVEMAGIVQSSEGDVASPIRIPYLQPTECVERKSCLTANQQHMMAGTPIGFLDFPSEIRNMIYELVLVREELACPCKRPGEKPYHLFGLVCASRSISREVSSIFYSQRK